MQSYRLFNPNIPPPPIPTRELIINEGLKILQQSKNDKEWLKTWIERKKENSSTRISLSDYREKLIQHAHLLQQYENALKISNHELLLELKLKIEQSNHFIYNSNTVTNIQKQIHRRKSKRARIRRQKEYKQQQTISMDENIIDQPTTNEKSLQEKIQDITSILHTIEQLKHLHQIRKQDNSTSMTDTNCTTYNELIDIENLCTNKLNEYKDQMEKQSQKDLCNYLFNNHNQSFYESIDPNAQYYLRAHQNKINLVQIRQIWDQYLTIRMTSVDNRIPFQWHEPQAPCDSNWSQYIINKKE